MASRTQGTRISLTGLQTVYLGPGQVGPRDEDGYVSLDTTLRLIEGIRTTAIQEPADILGYLNSLQKRFVLRGRIRRQIRWLLSQSRLSLGKKVVYASHPQATHRVLVYAYHGRQVAQKEGFFSPEYLEGAYGSFLGILYEPDYTISPLARVDVRPPVKYLAGKYKTIGEYREAVASYAERIAIRWYQRFAASMGRDWRGLVVSGIAADLICVLKPQDRRTVQKRVWTNENIKPVRNGPTQSGDKQRTSLQRLFDDLSNRR